MVRLALVAMLVACGGEAEQPAGPDAMTALVCTDDLAALYARGCTMVSSTGERFDETDVRSACGTYIDETEPGCASRIAEFRACLAPQTMPPTQIGLSVLCE